MPIDSSPVLEPVVKPSEKGGGRHMVVIHNNDTNTFEEVISVVMVATGCDIQEAYIEVWDAHTYGKSAVHFADHEECNLAANIIRSIGVHAEVKQEWGAEC